MTNMRYTARLAALGLTVMLVGAACSSGSDDTTAATTTDATTGSTTETTVDPGGSTTTTNADNNVTTTTGDTTTIAGQDTTTTTSAEPVAGAFAAFVGGTTPRPCDDDKFPNQPPEYFGPVNLESTIRIGRIAVFCANGFDFSEPIDVTVTRPDGSEVTFRATLDGLNRDTRVDPLSGSTIDGDETDGFQWVVGAGNPTGTYTFTVSQGSTSTPPTTSGGGAGTTTEGTSGTTTAPETTTTTVAQQSGIVTTATVEIAGSSTPMIEPFREGRGGFGGGPIRFAISGFGSGTAVPLGIYKDLTDPFAEDGKDHDFELVTFLGPVSADGGGSAVVTLQDDGSLAQSERYCLATDLRFINPPNCDNFRGGWFTP